MRAFDLDEAAAFLHMNAEELRARAKRGIIPGAKIGRRWVFLEDDLVELIRSKYPASAPRFREDPRQDARPSLDGVDLGGGRTASRGVSKECEELLWPSSKRTRGDRDTDEGRSRAKLSSRVTRPRNRTTKPR